MSWWSNYKLLYQRQVPFAYQKMTLAAVASRKCYGLWYSKHTEYLVFSEFIIYKEPYRICEKRNKWLQKKNYSIKGLRHFMKNVYRFNIFPFCIFFHVFPCCKYCFSANVKAYFLSSGTKEFYLFVNIFYGKYNQYILIYQYLFTEKNKKTGKYERKFSSEASVQEHLFGVGKNTKFLLF